MSDNKPTDGLQMVARWLLDGLQICNDIIQKHFQKCLDVPLLDQVQECLEVLTQPADGHLRQQFLHSHGTFWVGFFCRKELT